MKQEQPHHGQGRFWRYSWGMRLALALCLFASPCLAWEFTTNPVCTISHATPDGEMVVTYDPREAKPYAIAVEVASGAWPGSQLYQIRFEGPTGFTISTNRHRLSEDARSVIAEDTGFGNVLDGLEYNVAATALLGDRALTIPLTDATPAVRKFRDCTSPGLS